MDTGAFNPILGYSYEELAVLSRSMHHSQGTGAMRRPGPSRTHFGLLAGQPGSGDLFDGIDTTWNRLPGGAPVGQIFAQAIRDFEPAHPEKVIPLLVKARPLVAAIHDHLANLKLEELDETMAECAGIWMEAQAHQPEVVPGADLAITTTVLNRSSADVTFESARIEGIWNEELPAKPARLGNNQSAVVDFHAAVPPGQPYSQPYWLVKPPSGDVYTVDARGSSASRQPARGASPRAADHWGRAGRIGAAGAFPLRQPRRRGARAAPGGDSGGSGESARPGGGFPGRRPRAKCTWP